MAPARLRDAFEKGEGKDEGLDRVPPSECTRAGKRGENRCRVWPLQSARFVSRRLFPSGGNIFFTNSTENRLGFREFRLQYRSNVLAYAIRGGGGDPATVPGAFSCVRSRERAARGITQVCRHSGTRRVITATPTNAAISSPAAGRRRVPARSEGEGGRSAGWTFPDFPGDSKWMRFGSNALGIYLLLNHLCVDGTSVGVGVGFRRGELFAKAVRLFSGFRNVCRKSHRHRHHHRAGLTRGGARFDGED